eukprot:GDKI01040570.1.p1 GENE.GDKI01040570.1~~GDKI01040570.1.p1  ORF type:complete len:116 (-),score=18.90 GDKI01040570.1:38-385(-)
MYTQHEPLRHMNAPMDVCNSPCTHTHTALHNASLRDPGLFSAEGVRQITVLEHAHGLAGETQFQYHIDIIHLDRVENRVKQNPLWQFLTDQGFTYTCCEEEGVHWGVRHAFTREN